MHTFFLEGVVYTPPWNLNFHVSYEDKTRAWVGEIQLENKMRDHALILRYVTNV